MNRHTTLATIGAATAICIPLISVAQQTQAQSFGQWRVECRVDAMSDKKSCLVLANPAQLWFGVQDGRVQMVGIGSRHDPGSLVFLRLDAEPAVSTAAPGFTGSQALAIAEGMLKAQRVKIRFTKFPRDTVNNEYETKDFEPALAHAVKSTGVSAP